MFIAIIALAAAPQALQDARRLANAVEDRAQSEFWSIFLSYQTPSAKSTEARGKIELLAGRRSNDHSNCPLQRMVAQIAQTVSESKTGYTLIRARSLASNRRAKAQPVVTPQAEEPQTDDEMIASLDTARPVEFSEREKSALNALRLHARDSEKLSGAFPKPSMAFYWQDEDTQIKIRPVLDVNKLPRRKARDVKERNNTSREMPEPPSEETE